MSSLENQLDIDVRDIFTRNNNWIILPCKRREHSKRLSDTAVQILEALYVFIADVIVVFTGQAVQLCAWEDGGVSVWETERLSEGVRESEWEWEGKRRMNMWEWVWE